MGKAHRFRSTAAIVVFWLAAALGAEPREFRNIVVNGDFDGGVSGWKALKGAALSVEDEELSVRAAPGGGFSQSGLSLVKGREYLLSFVCGADRETPFAVSLRSAAGSIQYLPEKAMAGTLGKRSAAYQAYFMAASDCVDAVLSFSSGTRPSGSEAALRFDRVVLRETGGYMDREKTAEERAAILLSMMTLDEKLGQMVQAERSAVERGDLTRYGIGSILSGGGSVPIQNDPEGWTRMYNRFQAEALATRLGIPIIYGVDAVHGHNSLPGAVIFPHNIGLGATRDAGLVERIGEITAREVAATGVDWSFSPCLAVSRDERWGRTYESFGESPELQSLLAAAAVRGLQGAPGSADWMKGPHIVATAKHFLGDGGAEYGSGEGSSPIDRGDISTLSIERLKALHARGYEEAVREKVGAVMASFSSFQGRHMHAYKELLTDYLKGSASSGGLGFEGFVIGDWDGISLISEIPGSYSDKVCAAFNAGLDMSMDQSRWLTVIEALKGGVGSSAVPMSRVDDAVRRILTVKFRSGAFDQPWALGEYADEFGSDAHRAVAARAVKESLVLLKNSGDVLPLRPGDEIFVGGPLADDIGLQCGGWTVQWQGSGDPRGGRLVKGTSFLEGMVAQAAASGGKIVTDIGKAKGCHAAVVFVGEPPYAEGKGDVRDPGAMKLLDYRFGKNAEGNVEAIESALSLGIPVVVVLVSGRPLIVTEEIGKWQGFVAAWLPGSEGGALAEVLYGKENFSGKLPVTWPRTYGQLPINQGDPDYVAKDPLFPYGFGLEMKLR